MNPIEEVFAEVKQANNTTFQQTTSPREVILTAFHSITKKIVNPTLHMLVMYK